jgi:hypothetical protein
MPKNQTPAPNNAAGGLQAPKNLRTAQVHISYLSKQLNFIISEQFLRDVFCNFGQVLEIALKKTCVDPVSVLFFFILPCYHCVFFYSHLVGDVGPEWLWFCALSSHS